jgi:ubiquinone/menaquinone biosynthesis C-methylase UbiE
MNKDIISKITTRNMISNELKKVINDRIYFLNYEKKQELFRKYNTEKDIINELSKISTTRGIKSGYVATQQKSMKKLAYLESLFKRINQPVKNLLDIGGADGSMGVSIAKTLNINLKNVTLIDVNPQPKEEYKSEGVKYKHGSASQLEVLDSSYDVCILSMVLHHLDTLEKQLKCLEEVYRVLKPGGYLFIREHDVHDGNEKVFKYIHLLYSSVLTNELNIDDALNEKEYYLDYNTIKDIVKNIGFVTVEPMVKDPNKKNLNEAYGFLLQKPN